MKVVQDRLGHTSAQMTLDVYSHLWPEDEDRTRDAVDAALSRQIVSSGSLSVQLSLTSGRRN